jgi:hypothetical protein
MRLLILLFFFVQFLTGCRNSHSINKNISEADLYSVLKQDTSVANYCDAMKALVYACSRNKDYKEVSAVVTAAIVNNEVKNVTDYREKYIANGGDSVFLNAFNMVLFTQQEIKRRYRPVIEQNPGMFRRVVQQSCPPM